MNRLIDALATRRWIVWTFVLLMTTPAIVGVLRLEISDEPRLLTNEDDAQGRQLEELSETFELDAPEAVLVVQAEDIFSRQTLTALRDLVDEVRQLEGVERVESLLDVPTFEQPSELADFPVLGWLASLQPRSLVPPPGAERQRIADAREAAIKHPLAAGLLLSKDARTTLVFARLSHSEQGEAARAVVRRLEDVAERYSDRTAMLVRVTGVTPIRAEILENLRTEMPRFLGLAVAVALVVAVGLFGQLLPALIAGGASLLGVLWTLGALGLVGQPLDVVNSVLPTLVLVIGFTDAVHLIFEFRRGRGRGDSPSVSAVASVKRVGRACALTSLTTTIGFGSLALAQTDVIRQFGLAAAAGTVLTFLAVVTLVPLVCSTTVGGRVRAPRSSATPAKWMQRCLTKLGEVVVLWRRSVTAGGVILAVVLGSTALALQPSNRLTDALPSDTEAYQALQHVDKKLGGILEAQVILEWSEELESFSPQVLSAMRDVHRSVSAGGAQAWSILNAIETLPEEYQSLLPYLDVTEIVFQRRVEQLLQPERRQALIHIRLPDWGTATNAQFFSDLRDRLREIEREQSGIGLHLTGRTVVASEKVGRVMQDLGGSIGLAAGLISLVMSLGFRSLRLGLISILPNLFPLAVVAAVIYLSGGVVTLTALMVFSVCLGIATDDTIHFLNGFRHQRSELDRAAAVIDAMRRVGPALATSTLVLLAGFGAASLSSIPTTQEFSRLASLAVATALIADVTLLPALLSWHGPRRSSS